MNISPNYINWRVRNLTKEQCEYLIRELEFVPTDITLVTGGIPYVIGRYDDESDEFDEFAPYPYEDNEDVVDYVARMAEEMCIDRADQITQLPWQWYRATSTRYAGYKLPWGEHTSEPWMTRYCYASDYRQYKNESTAIGMETQTQCANYMLRHCILPLTVIAPHMLEELYVCRYRNEHGVPRTDFCGIGIDEFERLWTVELGGTVDHHWSGDLFPWNVYIRNWKMSEEQAKQILEFMHAVDKHARDTWPEDYDKWLLPIPEETDDEDEEDEDEIEDDEDEEVTESETDNE